VWQCLVGCEKIGILYYEGLGGICQEFCNFSTAVARASG